ncbi:hypothetical protein B0T21DRAFT_451413 [Apiosordaria backusii]|uniref:Uncharacterized protein n=1 Tax=Apiosordaria backusii TaxID=314023 RepID=A0AA40BM83_9PEZI|nr:hypothetical protein B0T21DRAFT_451413 [Apiosordaria backusii]
MSFMKRKADGKLPEPHHKKSKLSHASCGAGRSAIAVTYHRVLPGHLEDGKQVTLAYSWSSQIDFNVAEALAFAEGLRQLQKAILSLTEQAKAQGRSLVGQPIKAQIFTDSIAILDALSGRKGLSAHDPGSTLFLRSIGCILDQVHSMKNAVPTEVQLEVSWVPSRNERRAKTKQKVRLHGDANYAANFARETETCFFFNASPTVCAVRPPSYHLSRRMTWSPEDHGVGTSTPAQTSAALPLSLCTELENKPTTRTSKLVRQRIKELSRWIEPYPDEDVTEYDLDDWRSLPVVIVPTAWRDFPAVVPSLLVLVIWMIHK